MKCYLKKTRKKTQNGEEFFLAVLYYSLSSDAGDLNFNDQREYKIGNTLVVL